MLQFTGLADKVQHLLPHTLEVFLHSGGQHRHLVSKLRQGCDEPFVASERVVTEVPVVPGKRPLFILLDATWPEARKMFRKSPYLNHLPVLSLQPEQLSCYRLRRSTRDEHLCTSEVASLCLALGGEPQAGDTLEAYLEVFTSHYLNAKQSVPPDLEDAAHQRLRALTG